MKMWHSSTFQDFSCSVTKNRHQPCVANWHLDGGRDCGVISDDNLCFDDSHHSSPALPTYIGCSQMVAVDDDVSNAYNCSSYYLSGSYYAIASYF